MATNIHLQSEMKFKNYYNSKKRYFEKYLTTIFQKEDIPNTILKPMKYSLYAGGKRIRPVLVLMVDDLIRNKFSPDNNNDILKIGASLEVIHTYSLIHDDLPAMDDDDLRRGKPTNHKRFDEATAILAGDGLLTFAFKLLSTIKNKGNIANLVSMLSNCAGAQGMVGGQILDMQSDNKKISSRQMKKVHSLKTGALISAAILLPSIYHNKKFFSSLEKYSQQIGISFQIVDDILDVISSDKELGKPVGSDEKNKKSTYVSLMGLTKAKIIANMTTETAKKQLSNIKSNTEYLESLADYILNRVN